VEEIGRGETRRMKICGKKKKISLERGGKKEKLE